MTPVDRSAQHGQAIALFAIALGALVLGAAIVVDGGYAFAQRRSAQTQRTSRPWLARGSSA